ncbi:Up-regulated during skeletal muscle growth protein 5, partial [Armadillidium vulgare]
FKIHKVGCRLGKDKNIILQNIQPVDNFFVLRPNSLIMAGDNVDPSQFKGLSKHFNSQTIHGRANVTLATYAGIATIYIFVQIETQKEAVTMSYLNVNVQSKGSVIIMIKRFIF